MRKLPKTFRKYGYNYIQKLRYGKIALFQGSRNNYEVIRIQIKQSRKTPSGKEYPKGEYYPSNSEWGKHGFTHMSPKSALRKFNELAEIEHLKIRKGPWPYQKAVKIG